MTESTIAPGGDDASHPDEVFVVVCGMPRSGTRQFADFLNRHTAIAVQGEIRPSLIRSIRKLLSEADAAYPSGYAAKYYHKKRARIVADMFAGLSKGRRVSKPKAHILGFKTPLGEHYGAYVDDIVGDSFAHTSYFYCIRNIVDCYLSLIEMPWFIEGPNAYITSYINSLNNAVALQEQAAAGGSRLSIGVLNLDDFIRSDAKAAWVEARLFAPLPATLAPGWIDEIVGSTSNRNATEKATGKRRKKELTGPATEVFLHRQAEIEHAVARFNAAFSENLTCKLPSVELVA
jgi:hypothetical protein